MLQVWRDQAEGWTKSAWLGRWATHTTPYHPGWARGMGSVVIETRLLWEHKGRGNMSLRIECR